MTSTLTLITGGTGFIGTHLAATLVQRGHGVRCAVRQILPAQPLPGVEYIALGDFGRHTAWAAALDGVDCVIHLAARTHVLHETASDPLAEYRRINVLATEKLARDAITARVKRLVFASSIKVNGEITDSHPFSEEDAPQPQDAYGQSKMEAELALRAIGGAGHLRTVIVRLPLVYGPGVKGNFARLLAWADHGIPLPLASVHNRRSLVYVGNVVDALSSLACEPHTSNTYLLSDGEDVSTPQLYRMLAEALGRRARLIPCPVAVLQAAATLFGRKEEMMRLTGSLQIDSSKIRRELAWQPPFSLAEGLAQTARWYHAHTPRDTKLSQ